MSSPLNGGAGLAGKSGRKTANACDTNAIEMSAETTAHFIFVARNTFIKVSNIVVQQVICFPDQFLPRKDLPGKFQLPRLHNIAQFPRLLVRQQQRAFLNPNHKQ
jgi:hypothetical protein